ncbi:MAG: hypothetical protein CVT83_01030 [Alphaproteobacteria bacterium HGW-Alphaproteobacteria-5]|jgi:predicted MFS family arabinose efflux permease|nr:MAG: hypothetical protein CVT83_01030 [Alphaproteobacteria bacterium HGW-Alphaproteobacteria-5]
MTASEIAPDEIVPDGGQQGLPGKRRWVVLALLMVLMMFNLIDRQIVFILAEPLKEDLGLSDTQLGILGGIAFSLVYALAAIPIARAADRYSKRIILTICVVVWSLMTALGATAQGFVHLALTRCGVALGEAGGSPISQALVAESFPPAQRMRAMGLLHASVAIGIMMGSAAGGWLAGMFSWRIVLVIVAVPTLFIAPLCLILLPDRRDREGPAPRRQSGVADALTLLRLPSLGWALAGTALYSFATAGPMIFTVPFLMRAHGFTIGEAGLAFGAITGAAGVAATVSFGFLAERLQKRDPAWPLRLAALACATGALCYITAWWAGSTALLLVALSAAWIATGAYLPITNGTAQQVAPAHLRALAAALVLVAMSMIGTTTSSVMAGFLSDVLRPVWGDDGLRIAMTILSASGLLAGAAYLFASRQVVGLRASP